MCPSILTILLGSALGGVCRFAITQWVPRWSTFMINCTGAFLIGVLVASQTVRVDHRELLILFAGIGFIGSFTTVSTWALEMWMLLKSRAYGHATLKGLGTWAACLLAVACGLALGRLL